MAPLAWADGNAIRRFNNIDCVPGELLVKYKRSTRSIVSKSRGRHWRAATLRRFKSVGIHQVRIGEGMTLDEALESCRQDPDVAYAEPNYRRYASVDPDDPYFVSGDLWGLEKINLPEAWDTQTGSVSVVVAVLDTGIDWNHEDLAANIWINPGEDVGVDGIPNTGDPGEGDGIVQLEEANDEDDDKNGYVDDFRGWNFVGNPAGNPPVEGDNNPDDDNGHGTHVSGTIGGEGDNGIGITGVTWAVSIMPLKTLNNEGEGSVAEEIGAIEYAIANGASIMNASFSGENDSDLEYLAIKSARDAGILLVAAAGNSGSDNDYKPEYPAAYDLDNIIAVAATDHNDNLVSIENWKWGSNYGATSVDVAAPGVQIYSTMSGDDDNYDEKSGTSMAAPHVSGLAALIWSEDPAFTYSEVKGFIFDGVDVLGTLTGKMLMAGRINANTSVRAAANGTIEVPDFPPSDLVAATASASQIDLTWTDNASDETGTRIERATNAGGPYSHVGTAAANVESYADGTVNDLTTYYYRVLAFNAAGATAASNTESATTPFAAPDNLLVITVSSSRIDLFWADNSSGESGYRIERKTGPTGTYSEIATVGTNDDNYADTGLGASTTYFYRVRAFNDNGVSSPYSIEASAETNAALSASGVSTGDGGGGGGGCFISAGEYSILSTLWLLFMAFIFVGFVAWLGMPRRITIKGTSKNCL
jgi:subtilisin family serine protease